MYQDRIAFDPQRRPTTPLTRYEWMQCIGRKGALCRRERALDSPKVCEIRPNKVVRKVNMGSAHKKDGSTERRLRVLIPGDDRVREGWVSAKLFVACGADEAARMDTLHVRGRGDASPFRAPPAAVAKEILDEARTSRRPRPDPGYVHVSPTAARDLGLEMPPLPRRDVAQLRRLPFLVSVLVPTSPNRRWAHRSLYECFKRQHWPHKELVVLETGDDPSRFAGSWRAWMDDDAFGGGGPWEQRARSADGARVEASEFWTLLDDDRVTYVYERDDAELGPKRNALGAMARGEILVQFDDDDVYLPHYLDAMVHALLLDDVGAGVSRASSIRANPRPQVNAASAFDPTVSDDLDEDALVERVKERGRGVLDFSGNDGLSFFLIPFFFGQDRLSAGRGSRSSRSSCATTRSRARSSSATCARRSTARAARTAARPSTPSSSPTTTIRASGATASPTRAPRASRNVPSATTPPLGLHGSVPQARPVRAHHLRRGLPARLRGRGPRRVVPRVRGRLAGPGRAPRAPQREQHAHADDGHRLPRVGVPPEVRPGARPPLRRQPPHDRAPQLRSLQRLQSDGLWLIILLSTSVDPSARRDTVRPPIQIHFYLPIAHAKDLW